MEMRQLDKTALEVNNRELELIKSALKLYHTALARDMKMFQKDLARENITKEVVVMTAEVETLCQDFEIEGFEFS